MEMQLTLENSWSCVSTEAVTDAVADKKALARIVLSLQPALYQYVRQYKTAHEAWTKLAASFEDKGLYHHVV